MTTNTPLKFLLSLIISVICIGCAAPDSHTKHFKNLNNLPKSKEILARITAYNNHEDKFGSKVAMSSKMRAKEGVTIAAHPDFHFGTKVCIPGLKGIVNRDGIFEIEDRGSAVTKQIASRGQYYVFDIYLHAKNKREGRRRINEFTSKIPPIEPVIFLN